MIPRRWRTVGCSGWPSSTGWAAVYILPTVIAIARQVEGLGWVICLNAIPVGWPAGLLLACLMPRKRISNAPHRQRPRGQ